MNHLTGLRGLLPRWLNRTDLELFRKLAGSDVPMVGPYLRPLSDAANRSRLWMGISLLLALLGGRPGRRAALRGMLSVATTSLIVNLPAKWLAGRIRPDHTLVPQARRLLRFPTSSSFPSGHAASAFAFTAGASQEVPLLAVPLGALAGGVGLSRVYTGAHFPSDVVVGAALGTTFGLIGRTWWPVAPRTPASTRPTFTFGTAEPLVDGTGLIVVANQSSTEGLTDPLDKVRQLMPQAGVVEAPPEELKDAFERAIGEAAVIGAMGGDGTVSLAAGIAHGEGKPVVVMPAGTLNHLARDLAIDSVDQAIDALREGNTSEMDIARIDGRAFVNTASFGAYSDLVDARERLEHLIGKWPAFVIAMFRVLGRSTPVDVEIDGQRRSIWMIFIGNGRYHPGGFAPSWRERLDDGLLDVRLIDAHQPWARTRMIAALLTGKLGESRVYEEWTTREIRIRSRQGALRLAADGETFDGGAEFVIRKEDEPLVVYVPAAT